MLRCALGIIVNISYSNQITIVLRIKERYRECPEYFLILDGNWLNNEDEEI